MTLGWPPDDPLAPDEPCMAPISSSSQAALGGL